MEIFLGFLNSLKEISVIAGYIGIIVKTISEIYTLYKKFSDNFKNRKTKSV